MRRMSSQDAAFLYGETPTWHMHVASLVVVDPASSDGLFSFDRVRDLTMERLPHVPQFRWRLVDVPFGVGLPGWVEAPEVDPEFHIKSVWLDPPGDQAALSDLVGDLVATKLDREHPLWEIYLIGGLADGRTAVLTKAHHALIDGITGAGLSEVLMDITREPRPAPTEGREVLDDARPSSLELFLRGVISTSVRTPLRLARFGVQSARQALALSQGMARSALSAIPYTAPKTHLTGEFSARRKLGMITLDIGRIKAVRKAYGVTVNDVVLALCAGALREYLREHNDLPAHGLVVQCPVSLRTAQDRDSPGTKVGSMFVELATNLKDPVERLRACAASAAKGKQTHQTLGEHHSLGVTETAPPGVLGLAARMFTAMHLERAPAAVNLVISNVPGPQLPLYVAGADVQGMFPMGPLLMGMGVNITALSHNQQLDVGVFSCPDLVPDPQRIADLLGEALDELEQASTTL